MCSGETDEKDTYIEYTNNLANITQLKERMQDIQEHSSEIQKSVQDYAKLVEEIKLKQKKRRETIHEARNVERQNQQKSIEMIQKHINHTITKWNTIHERSAEARVYMCREVAGLLVLRQRRRKRATEYLMNGLLIPDIRDLHGK